MRGEMKPFTMTYSLSNIYAKRYYNRTIIVQVIIMEGVFLRRVTVVSLHIETVLKLWQGHQKCCAPKSSAIHCSFTST